MELSRTRSAGHYGQWTPRACPGSPFRAVPFTEGPGGGRSHSQAGGCCVQGPSKQKEPDRDSVVRAHPVCIPRPEGT